MTNTTLKLGKIKTSTTELIDITKAWLALSFAFALVYSGIQLLGGNSFVGIFSFQFLIMLLTSLFTAGIGFLFHELAHKFAAQKYGCVAEFRAFDQMLYVAVGLAALIGFIFAAPGAVMISGQITRKENGIISAVGPLTNFILAMIFLGLMSFYSPLAGAFQIGFYINMWLGLFNLIPFGHFDGIKIFRWQPIVWGSMVAFGLLFLFVF
ncbi:metalloprotease [Candidatus Woesearchaeota archaeon CG10_big_fil_rev_8_21_14_0_10_36_11]|nr:MAG: metalloprotease [Candidatus Woesearchaeota archaeon CG10_big_fil_rev_8_21_14_0_10_36_11]